MKRSFLIIVALSIVLSAKIVRDNSKEVVIDTKTKLMWQDNSIVKTKGRTWKEAITYCQNLELAGFKDWRLPTIKELHTIADDYTTYPSILKGFKNVESYYYWTISTNINNKAWKWDFGSGTFGLYPKSKKCFVRCVRNHK